MTRKEQDDAIDLARDRLGLPKVFPGRPDHLAADMAYLAKLAADQVLSLEDRLEAICRFLVDHYPITLDRVREAGRA